MQQQEQEQEELQEQLAHLYHLEISVAQVVVVYSEEVAHDSQVLIFVAHFVASVLVPDVVLVVAFLAHFARENLSGAALETSVVPEHSVPSVYFVSVGFVVVDDRPVFAVAQGPWVQEQFVDSAQVQQA